MIYKPKNIPYSKKINVRGAASSQSGRPQRKNIIISILTHLYPFINSPTKIIGLLLLLLSTGAIVYTLLTRNVFIDDVVLEGDVAGKGEVGQKLLERAIALKDLNFQERREKLKIPSFLTIKDGPSSEAKSSRNCSLIVDLAAEGTLFRSDFRGTKMSSHALDAVVSKDSVSLRKLAFQIREMFNWKARELSPVLSYVNNEYVLTLHSSPPAGEPKKRVFSDFNQAASQLSAAIVDYLAPELAASEDIQNGYLDLSEHYDIADIFLADKQKSLLISYLKTIAVFEKRGYRSDFPLIVFRIQPATNQLLADMDFSRYGSQGPIIKFFLHNRIAIFERLKNLQNNLEYVSDTNFRDHVLPFVEDLEQTRSGLAVLGLAYIDYNKFDDFFHVFDNLLSRPIAEGVQNIDLFLLYSDLLIDKNPNLLSKLVSTQFAKDYEQQIRPPSVRSEREAAFASVLSIADILNGKMDRFDKLGDVEFPQKTCAALMMANQVQKIQNLGLLPEKEAPLIVSRIAGWFPRLEMAGLGDRGFYEIWARFSILAGDPRRAIDLYDKSNEYEGDRSWGLLNAGFAALQARDFIKAKERYTESLSTAEVPNAFLGLLEAHRELVEDENYLKVYDRYFDGLVKQDYVTRVQVEINARLAACRLRRGFKTTLMHKNEILVDKNSNDRTIIIDDETCSYKLQ